MKTLKTLFAAAAAVTMSFTTLAGNATWQLASGQAFRGDGQACLYQTYTDNDGADWYTVDLGDVVSAFANGTLDLSNPPRSTGYSGANGVKGPADVVDGVFAPQATTLGNMNDWWFSLVALVKVNGQDMLYVSGLNEKGGEGKYTTLLEFSLGTAEYDATGGYKGKGYYRRPVPTAKAVVENDGKTLRFVYDTADYGTKGTGWFSVAEAEAIGSISEGVPWRDCAENVTNAIFDASFAAYKPAQFINWFFGFYRLAAIEGIDNLDTSAAADFSYMFGFCLSLEALDVTCFDTANATNMSCMFGSCSSLTSLDVSGFNTANVVNMDGLFYECSSLTDLDVTHFDTSKVTDMDGMFANCYALASLDVTGFDTANVTNMYEMFYACSSLMSLDVTGFDTSKVTDMYDMFGWCESLASLDVTGFDTAQVTDMGGMFYSCGALTSLDLTGFDTAKVKNMSYMFYNATNLATIVACDSFATSALNSDEKMFLGCVKLVGGNGTAFDDGMIDATAARIDRAGAPGYFTAPPPGTFFTLSFDANGGDDYAHSQMILSTNALRTLPSAVPTRPAYKFLGWATTADGEAAYQAGDRYATGAAGASATLYAKWVNVGDYTIRFDGNSAKATGVPEDIVTPYGSKPTIPADPARDYWTFDGWTNSVNDHVYHAGDLFDEGCEGSSVFVLYAKWSAASASDLEYVDAAGSTWTYDRKGDEVTITDFTPGAEATDATPPATIDDCTVTNPDFDPGLVYSAGAWLTYSISSGKASITGFVGTLPANLVIPEAVTAGRMSYSVEQIGYCAFDATTKPHRTTLKSVVIPGSVKVIDSAAFRYCEALETVTLGEGVERIISEAFIYAGAKLAEIEFPHSLTNIGISAFWSVRRACAYAADGGLYADTGHTFLIAIDPDLEGEVVVADTVKITSDGVCMKLKATSVVFPSGLEVFGRNSTFQENSHTVAVTLPGSARLGEGSYTGHTTYIKTVTVMGAPPSWNLKDYFTGLTTITYPASYAAEWEEYKAAHPELEYVEIQPAPGPGGGSEAGPVPEPKAIPTLFDVEEAGSLNPNGATYNGFLGEEALGGTFTLVVKKPKKGASSADATLTAVDAATGKKVKTIGTADMSTGVCSGGLAGLVLGAKGVGGSLGGVAVQGALDAAKAKDQSALAVMSGFDKRAYSFVFADAEGGLSLVTATFSTKGKAKVAGTVNGAKVSGSAQMSVGDRCVLPFAYAKKGVTATFVLWFDGETKELTDVTALGEGATLRAAGEAEAPEKGPWRFSLAAEDVLASAPDAIEETPLEVAAEFDGKSFAAGKAAKVSYKGGVVVDTSKGDNVLALALKYSKNALSGSFVVYEVTGGKLVKDKFTVSGVVIGGVGYAVGTNKKLKPIPAVLTR